MGGGGEPAHVQAGFGDDGAGQVRADARDLRQPGHRGQHRGVRAGAGVRAGGPVAVDAPCVGHRRDRAVIRAVSWVMRCVEEGDLVQQQPASSPWWSSNMPSRASTRSSCLAFIRVRARPASARGSRSPAIIALIMSLADSVVSLEATLDSLTSAPSSSFSSRWQHRVRSWTSRVRARV